jgi:hypothetical protein
MCHDVYQRNNICIDYMESNNSHLTEERKREEERKKFDAEFDAKLNGMVAEKTKNIKEGISSVRNFNGRTDE